MFTTVIGVPYNSAGRTTGVARAPPVLAEAGLVPPGEPRLVDLDLDLPPGVPVRGPSGLREEGIAAATRRAVEAIAAQRSWWLHVDLDVLATDQLAAVDYPQGGGLTWVELTALVGTALSRRGCLSQPHPFALRRGGVVADQLAG